MAIHYDHNRNEHSVTGAEAALPQIFGGWRPRSILDVGCGTGTWMKAALNIGIKDVFGIDGIEVTENDFLVENSRRAIKDLTTAWSLERRFDAVLCLEVGEHLNEVNAATLINALVAHSDYVVFSAACPQQRGQHHVNCQWPAYWQGLFNEREYACSDDVRWRIWNDDRIEPWYRQNMFVATRSMTLARLDPQITPVVHPGVWCGTMAAIEHGCLEWHWYLSCPALALLRKAMRPLKKGLSKSVVRPQSAAIESEMRE